MRLPDNAIGISDILSYRDCRRRWGFQMRRWTEGGDPPEDVHPDTMYGKAIHDGFTWIEEDLLTDDEAVERCFEKYGHWLEPEDADRLRDDFATYRERDETGVITVANETEIKVPLIEHTYPGDDAPTVIYFRARIDRLYRNAQNPTVFVHRDYKSSKWRKSEDEVHEDKQMWAYNCAIHLRWPECASLEQMYDQLRYGVVPTRKTTAQRRQMWEWLRRQVKAIVEDESFEPTHNQWCPWCPIMESCSEVKRLSEWAIARIEELSPDSGKLEPSLLEGRSFEEYVEDLPIIERARKMAKRYEESVRGELKKLPDSRVDELGYRKGGRSETVFEPGAMRAIHEMLADDFYSVVSLTKTRVEKMTDAATAEKINAMATKVAGATTVTKKT